jgi:hypothetical protein
MQKTLNVIFGLSSISILEASQSIPTDPGTIEVVVKLIVQVAVGIVTIYVMLRKKKVK